MYRLIILYRRNGYIFGNRWFIIIEKKIFLKMYECIYSFFLMEIGLELWVLLENFNKV